MPPEADLARLVGLCPDQRLLDEDAGRLPLTVGRPETIPETRARRRIVGVGATMTGVTLILGVVLASFGAVDGFATGFDVNALLALILGIILATTHWTWVHVAEISANALESHLQRNVLERRRQWLSAIEPYTRWEVGTTADEDGSITILTTRYRPTASEEDTFTFSREIVARERHPGEEPAAQVAERAELLRRDAAAETERDRQRYSAAYDAYEQALLAHANEQERLAAVRAASEALSERINSNLRDPPLIE